MSEVRIYDSGAQKTSIRRYTTAHASTGQTIRAGAQITAERLIRWDATASDQYTMQSKMDRLEDDVKDIKGILGRIEPALVRMDAFVEAIVPTLAAKEDVAGIRATLPSLATKEEMAKKPSKSDFSSLVEKVDKNFIITWCGIIACTVGLASLIAKGFHWI